jgi:hypothetical protein
MPVNRSHTNASCLTDSARARVPMAKYDPRSRSVTEPIGSATTMATRPAMARLTTNGSRALSIRIPVVNAPIP